jgi:hypothetical protein
LLYIAKFIAQVNLVQILNFAVLVIVFAFVFNSYPLKMYNFYLYLVFKEFFKQIYLFINPFKIANNLLNLGILHIAKAIEVAFC